MHASHVSPILCLWFGRIIIKPHLTGKPRLIINFIGIFYCFCNFGTILIITDREVLLTERYSRSVLLLKWLPWGFFPPLRLTLATAKSSNSIIFKFLLLIQQ